MNELAAWTSGAIGETAGFHISERTVVVSIAVLFISLKLFFMFRSKKKSKEVQE